MYELNGKRVLVVGGSSGIGLATASLAAANGAIVTIASRSSERLEAAVRAIGHEVRSAEIDVTEDGSVDLFFRRPEHAHFDHVVVTASHVRIGPVKELALADAYASMQSKFWGAYRVARAASIAHDGSLSLVSGFLSVRPKKGSAVLGAINAALEALGKGLALELAPVRVNVVSPGFVDTPMWHAMPEAQRVQMLERTAAGLPVGRVGQGEDIARQILGFMTNRFMTGSVVLVDGGGAIS